MAQKMDVFKYLKDRLRIIMSFDYKGFLARVKKFDYKKLWSEIRSFDYKSSSEYGKLFQDKKFWRRVRVVIALLVLIFLLKGCFNHPPKEVARSRHVQTSPVIQKDVPIYIDSFGTLRSLYSADIVAQVTGKIEAYHFDEGKEVAKEDPLFTIDPRPYKADLDKSKAALAEDHAELRLKVDTLERNRGLIAKDLISQQDFEKYQTAVAAAEAKVEFDKAEIETAEINLGYCYIVSPIDGLTGKRLVDPGNIVTANSGPVLVNVKTIDPLYIDFTISERDLPRVRKAMSNEELRVEIRPAGDDDGPYNGELKLVDNAVDDLTGTVSLRATISNKSRKLWSGQFVKVKLILYTEKNAVLVPSKAVRIGQKGPYLFVVSEDDKADLRLIDIGQQEGDYVIAKKGAKVGESAVVAGQLGLSPGMLVQEDPADGETGNNKGGRKQ
ncbi:MAG: efflux RND transporter periplasmic adaptor subunit [Candidatus Omnitrophica bacterium]|nr:efflux RND transporter periplasmic adaptor subunit [Candidatus Omnitrophota bacterium]MBU1128623.1 efflux RND transporter periplasmic adaptor subunit [Candidatus Omnitrophota bacterium]MBU1852164.1 efflux RND transporter periplasmic adaptor subunit [Candidatus Omnitrophota bacterium]